MYREAARIAKAGARFVIVGYHPHFMLNGIPTHFNRATASRSRSRPTFIC